jgi:polyribonucleotide nucleotidyltransferase
MKGSLSKRASEISTFAPRMITMKINPEKIRDVIGKGGAVIRALTEETGTVIDIKTTAPSRSPRSAPKPAPGGQEAHRGHHRRGRSRQVYEGTVLRLLDFGAIVQPLPGKDGLLHISQIANERVNQVSDYLKEGQVVRVKVLEADDKGRVRLSMKAIAAEARCAGAGRPVSGISQATKKDAAASFFVAWWFRQDLL